MYPNIASMGVYASASISAVHSRKELELWEVCHTMLNKVPRGWNRVSRVPADPQHVGNIISQQVQEKKI